MASLSGQARRESAAAKFERAAETLRFVARLQPGAETAPRGLLLLALNEAPGQAPVAFYGQP